MLVLTRKRDEQIVIGSGPDRITIQVVEIRGEQVRIGIEAPADVPIHRMEVYQAIHGDESAKAPLHGAKS